MDRDRLLEEIRNFYEGSHLPKIFVPGKSVVPVSGPKIYPEDIAYVANTLLDGWFTEWKECAKLEKALCQFTGMKHCILVNSGSSANLVAVTACVHRDHRGMTPTCPCYITTCSTGFPTTIYPIIQNNCIPLLVDFDPATLNSCIDQVLSASRDLYLRRNGIVIGSIIAHTLGFPFDDKELIETTKENNQFYIADVCDALGAFVDGKHVGSGADCMTLSFFPAHHITTGEGGAILTNDDELAKIMRRLVSWGRDCDCLPGQSNTCGTRFTKQHGHLPFGYDHKYVFSDVGYNLKMTELSGALGVAQMQHLDGFVLDRKRNFCYLSDYLKTLCCGGFLLDFMLEGGFSPFGFPIILTKNYSAQDLAKYLDEHRIQSRPIFAGNILRQPVADKVFLKRYVNEMVGSDYVMNHALWVGCHPSLEADQLDYVADTMKRYFDDKKSSD